MSLNQIDLKNMLVSFAILNNLQKEDFTKKFCNSVKSQLNKAKYVRRDFPSKNVMLNSMSLSLKNIQKEFGDIVLDEQIDKIMSITYLSFHQMRIARKVKKYEDEVSCLREILQRWRAICNHYDNIEFGKIIEIFSIKGWGDLFTDQKIGKMFY